MSRAIPTRGKSHDRSGAPLLGALRLTLAACGSPVRAVLVDRPVAQRDLTRSVFTAGELSWATRRLEEVRRILRLHVGLETSAGVIEAQPDWRKDDSG
jgi:hypothetical protein